MKGLVGIDIGTGTLRAVIYAPEEGRVIATAARPTPTQHPRPGWAEHDPDALWAALCDCLREVRASTLGVRIVSLAISSMAEAALPIDAAGTPLHPIIAWHDQRAIAHAQVWATRVADLDVTAQTGQPLSPSLSVTKWLWLTEERPDIAAHTAHWLALPDYLMWRLTGVVRTDPSIATRTGLFDQKHCSWSPDLLLLAGLSSEQLPLLAPSGSVFGQITPTATAQTNLPADVLCCAGGHDYLCAMFAVGATAPGTVVDMAGTAQTIAITIGETIAPQSVSSYTRAIHLTGGRTVLRGGLRAGGGAIAWLANLLDGDFATLEAEAAQGIGRRVGPLWLPHLLGAGTPEGDARSRGALVGLRAEHERGDVFRALLESLALWVRHNLATMRALTDQPITRIIALGGTTQLRQLVRLKAAALAAPITLPSMPEPSAVGAALLAGLGTEWFATASEAVASLRYPSSVVAPEEPLIRWYATIADELYAPLFATLRDLNHRFADITARLIPAEME